MDSQEGLEGALGVRLKGRALDSGASGIRPGGSGSQGRHLRKEKAAGSVGPRNPRWGCVCSPWTKGQGRRWLTCESGGAAAQRRGCTEMATRGAVVAAPRGVGLLEEA
nr:unnamed protein product [Digitaria exilis]